LSTEIGEENENLLMCRFSSLRESGKEFRCEGKKWWEGRNYISKQQI